MALTIPDIQNITNGTNGYDCQAVQDATDIAAQTAAANGTWVLWGMQCSWSSGMVVNVAAGAYAIGTVMYTYAGGSVTIANGSGASGDRRDIISINASGTLTATQGTACGTESWTRTAASTALPPVKPSIPAGNLLLGEVYVNYNASSGSPLSAICVVDKTTTAVTTFGTVLAANVTVTSPYSSGTTNAMALPLATGQTYDFEANIVLSNTNTGSTGAQVCVVVPAGAGVTYSVQGFNAGIVTGIPSVTAQTVVKAWTSSATAAVNLEGVVEMGTVSSQTGGLTIGFAGQTGSVSSMHGTATMFAGSNLVVRPVG